MKRSMSEEAMSDANLLKLFTSLLDLPYFTLRSIKTQTQELK